MELPDVSEKIGPLPMWGWILLGGGALFGLAALGRGGGGGGGGLVVQGGGAATPIVNGIPVEVAAANLARQREADKTLFGKMLGDAQQTAEQKAAAQQSVYQSKLDAQASVLDQLRAQLAALIGKIPTPGGPPADATPGTDATQGTIPAPAAPPPAPAPVAPAPVAATPLPPAPAPAQAALAYVAGGFRFFTGELLPAHAFTRITTRQGTTISLPSIYDPRLSAGDIFTNSGHPESAIGRVQRMLSDLQSGGHVYEGQTNNNPTDPRNVFFIMQRVIREAASAGYGGQSTGFVHANRYL